MRPVLAGMIVVCVGVSSILAQTKSDAPTKSSKLEFDVVSIKRNVSGQMAGGGKRMPDGGMVIVNQPIRSILGLATPVPVQEIVGAPSWTNSERYDITAKAPRDSTREEIAEMWRTMFTDRMKVKGHVEEKEVAAFALVRVRRDGRLGPNIKPAPPDCLSAPAVSSPTAAPMYFAKCGSRVGPTSMTFGATNIDSFAAQLGLEHVVDRLVTNRTGLSGFFWISLNYASREFSGVPSTQTADDLPDIYTALQGQLGLKLVPDRTKGLVFVIDYIERPSPN